MESIYSAVSVTYITYTRDNGYVYDKLLKKKKI